MGILPSRESHEYPGAFHFALSGSHAMAILPLTEHFFPSVDSLAFRQLYAGRDMQSAKYNFSLISPELLRKYRHRSMEQRRGKGRVGDEAMAPPAGRNKPQPYLRHGQPPGDDSDADGKWIGVDTIDASNYGQFFKDDTQCVSPNDPTSLSPDGDEEVCEELQWPNPVAHWRTHDTAKQLIQDRENELGFTDELNYVSLDGKGGGLRCLPSSLSLPCSSGQCPRYGQTHNASTEAGTDSTAATAHFTAEERDLVNRFFARSPEALYNALVVEPNKGFLVDTNKEMCRLYAAEQRWKEARNVVRAYRRQCKQDAAAGDAAQPAAGESPNAPKGEPQRRITKEEAEKAATVPPPPVFLRPVPQVIMVRMSREEEEATRAAYLAEQQRLHSRSGQSQQSQSGGGDDAAASMSTSAAAAGAAEGSDVLRPLLMKPVSHLHVPTTRYHSFEDDPKYKDGRIHLVEEDGVLYMFAYNTAYVDPRLRMRQQREELLKQQRQGKEREQQESQGGSLERGEACRSPSSTGAAVAGTAANVTASGTTASSPGSCSTERNAAASPTTDSGSGDGDGALCHASRQTSSFYHTVSAFGNEEDEVGLEEHGSQSKKAKGASPRRVSSTEGSPVVADTTSAVAATRTENTAEEADEEEDTTLSSAPREPGGHQRRQSAILADSSALLQRSDGKPSTSSDDDDDEDGDEQRKGGSASACSVGMTATTVNGVTSAAMREKRARVVQQLELVTAAPFILPICPVRIVGCNGYAESSCRGTPWLRGYEDEPEEDAYVESLPVKPPIMSGGGFIDANIGDKILSRAYLLGFQVYRNVCLDAGLPKTLTRPFWTLGLLSNIPLLQISREMRFRMRAAAAEVELGYRGLRDMIKGTENDLQSYIYGFLDILPYLQRVSRVRVKLAEAEAKAAAAAEGGDGAASSSLLPIGHGASETPEEEAQESQSLQVPPAIPTRSSQSAVQHNLLFPLNEMEFYTQFTIRGNQSLSRVRCEAQESFFHLIAEATAPVSTSLFMKPLELSTYDYGGAVRLHLLCNRVTGADELQVLPPPRNLDQLLSYHRRRLQLRRQPPASADGNAAAAAPPYLVYAVVHPSGKARGPSLEHYKKNLQAPEDGADANTLDEAEAAAAATDGTGGDRQYAAHQYTYPPGSFVDSDMVIYNVHKGRWEHFEYFHHQQLAQRRARKLQAQAETAVGEPDGNKTPAQSNKDTADAAAAKQAAESGEACRGALVPTRGGGFNANDDDDEQDIHLEDILLCWIKRRLQSATMRNRTDPGWLRDSEGHIVQEGRYYIWGFEQDGQQYFYGLIPKFAKEKKNKRHNTVGGNAHSQHHQDNHTRRITAHGSVGGPSSALNSHSRPQIGSSSSGGGGGSARDRHGTLPETLAPASQQGPVSGSINGQPTDGRGSGRMENTEVRSGPASAGESAKDHPAMAPAVSLTDVKGGAGSGLDTRADAPLNAACPDSHSRRQHQQQQQQQHPRSPGAVGGGGGRGTTSSSSAAASANTAGANRLSNPSNATSGARLPAQTSSAPRAGASEKSSPPTLSSPAAASASSSTSSPVAASTAPPAFAYNTPGVASRRAAGSRGAASPPPSAPAALVIPKESEAALAGRSGAAAVGRGGPSLAGVSLAQSPPLSVVLGGAAAEAASSSSNPRTLPQRQDGVSRISGRDNVSRGQQFSSSATTTAQFSRQSATAPAAASYTSAEEVGYRQGRGERRGNGAESAYASPHSQQRQQQQQQQGCRISDPGAVVLGYKGALQNRYHAPPHQHEYMQAPSSAAYDNSSNATNYGGGSRANRYAATSHTSGHSYSDVPPPPPPPQSPPPPPPLLPAGAENAAYEQSHEGYPAPVEQQHHQHQQQQQPSDSPPPPLHLHPPTVYMNTGAGQASQRPTLVLAGPRVPSPRHAQQQPQQQQQQQQYASYNTRPHQPQQHVSHQPSYKTQPAMAKAVSGARVQPPEMAPGPYHHHTQQMVMAMSAPNVGPAAPPPPLVQANAAMNTSSSRYAPHPRMVASGAGAAPMQEQQQLAPVTVVSVAPPSALAGGNSMYLDVSAASVAPSGSRSASYYPTSPSQVSYGTSSQTATAAMHPAGPQGNAASPHTGSGPPVLPPLKQQQQPAYPPSAMVDASTAGGQGSVANRCYLQQKKPQSPPSGPASAAPGGARYGQMTSPTSQQHAYQQQMGTRNASYDERSSGHNYGTYAASTANPNANSSFNRVGLSLSASAATVKAVTGVAGTSMLMSNTSASLPSTGSGMGRGTHGYAPQPSGYPTSGSTSFTATPVVAMAAGATAPASSTMSGAEGSAVNAFPSYQASPHPQQQQHQQPSPQQHQQQQQQASVGGRTAGVPSPAPHQYRTTPTAEQQQQQQRDSRYPLQVMTQSYSNDYNVNGGVPAMTTGGRASRGVAVDNDVLESSSYDDAVMHGSRGAQAAAGEYQLSYQQQQQQYQQPYPQWQQQQQHSTSASSQPSSCAPTPLPVQQQYQQQYATQAGNGSDSNGSRVHTHTQASRASATGNMNAPSAYAHEQQTSPYPQHAGAPPASPAAAAGDGSDRGAAAAVTPPAAVAHLSTPMQSANSLNSNVAAMTSAGSCESTQASSAAAQLKRSSDSYGYRSSRSGPTSPYLQASPQQQQEQQEPQRYLQQNQYPQQQQQLQQQQRSATRTTAAAGPFPRGAGGGLRPKAMMSAGGAPSASLHHAYTLHHHPQQQQQRATHSSPAPGGYYQQQVLAHPQQQQQLSVASQRLTATPNASGTLLRVSPGSQQRYNQQYQRQQQQKPTSPYTSTKEEVEGQMQTSGNYNNHNLYNSNVGVAEASYESSNNTTAQRFAHNPYAMQ
ncbi:conserved hypothetical protein [Leishmania major strain Friedlin]|uniref:Uncharacterized protein n=1 Tax=Leishmania major TaxID=5664 RepID=Q4QIA7_LEIMA|nr:conserved hypothetical protein [Leishmania major strain Friedlin]CAG9569359.1 hypothetical_protein_-_conserved [Leishmania major strain Friedlin]CAJ02241.1 conserved hypothetical protein [Leishmania major strain Friedlin]|eukprot:XP_001681091.1 conserved hypothetical protein [Leishmania major strain Friedlin]